MLLSLIGLLGGFCFAYCGVPAAWATWRAGRSVGTPVSVAWMIATGGVLMYIYLTALHGFDWVLSVNYAVEVASWLVVVWYHYQPRTQPQHVTIFAISNVCMPDCPHPDHARKS